MDRDNTQNRKRRRDQGDDKNESHKGKKPEIISSWDEDSNSYRDKGHEFCDSIGSVFDFPWLKEGVVFKVDDYLEPEDMFAPDQVPDTLLANLDQSCLQNSPDPPGLDRNFYDKKLDGDSLWSLQVDDLEPIDCIWSSLVDQPLDNMGLNKT